MVELEGHLPGLNGIKARQTVGIAVRLEVGDGGYGRELDCTAPFFFLLVVGPQLAVTLRAVSNRDGLRLFPSLQGATASPRWSWTGLGVNF